MVLKIINTLKVNYKNVDNTFNTPVILSLCPGVLGLERGLERAIGPVTVAAYVEVEAFVIANLVAAMEQGKLVPAPVWSDIKTFDGRLVRGKIHGIIGGYPCPPFSNAGKRLGTEDPRHLYPFISGIIEAAGPVWCFFENVEGHLTLGFSEVSADLRSMGYAVEAGIYSAEEVGAPHQRNRLFILAIKQEYLEYARGAQSRRISNSERWKQNIQIRDTGERSMAYTTSLQCYGSEYTWRRWFRPADKGVIIESEELAYTYGERYLHGQPEEQSAGRGEQSFSYLTTDGEPAVRKLAYPTEPGLQGYRATQSKEGPSVERGSGVCRDRWPARPGEQQYEWEEPRTATYEEEIERGMGSPADGYHFREDLLRAYGNSVVEQAAEVAFIDLLSKHLKA